MIKDHHHHHHHHRSIIITIVMDSVQNCIGDWDQYTSYQYIPHILNSNKPVIDTAHVKTHSNMCQYIWPNPGSHHVFWYFPGSSENISQLVRAQGECHKKGDDCRLTVQCAPIELPGIWCAAPSTLCLCLWELLLIYWRLEALLDKCVKRIKAVKWLDMVKLNHHPLSNTW